MQVPKKLSQTKLVDNGYRQAISKVFELENGKTLDILISASNCKKSVLIIPITQEGNILYIQEFRYGPEKITTSFPMGGVEDGLTSNENALKELREETGYTSDNIEYIGSSILENYLEGSMDYFIARNCVPLGNQALEHGEVIDVFSTKLEQFESMIFSGKVNCPLGITGFYLAKNKLITP